MKVVFVASGNKTVGTVSAFVNSQFESLKQQGVDMHLFPIIGKGWKAYAQSIPQLRNLIKRERPDIVHAHYSICGVVAAMACVGLRTKVVVSILGSFPHKSFKLYWVRFFVKHVWDSTITKSQRTSNQLAIDLPVIPNGVNLSQFYLIDKEEARRMLGLANNKRYVIFVSDPKRPEKNFALAQKSVELINDNNVELVPVYNKPHDEIVKYMCAADVLVLTSLNEGSPNVVKEAMACNCPIVSTDVGDVSWITNGVEGTYVAKTFSPKDMASLVQKALVFKGRTRGRERLLEFDLTTEKTAQKVVAIYKDVV